MSFHYNNQNRSAFDKDTQTTIRIAPTFLDIYPQPFQFITGDQKFYVSYEMVEEPRNIKLENGHIDKHRDVVGLKLEDWHVKCAFVTQMQDRLKISWPERIRTAEALKLYQASFEELERDGLREEYEAWKSYLIEGVHVCWTEGQTSQPLRVEFVEYFPLGVYMT